MDFNSKCFIQLIFLVATNLFASVTSEGDCPDLPAIENGELVADRNNKYRYTCDNSFYISQDLSSGFSLKLQCSDGVWRGINGIWDGTAPTCEKGCAEPDGKIGNAISSGTTGLETGFKVGTSISYKCVMGYESASEGQPRVCQSDFTWSALTGLDCQKAYCDNPVSPAVQPDYGTLS